MKKPLRKPKRVTVTFDAHRFERVAADFGMFGKDFLTSLNRAEADVRAGKTKKIKSLASLRK